MTFPVSAIVEKLACEAVGIRLCQVQEVASVNHFGERVREDVLHMRVGVVQDGGYLVVRPREVRQSFLVNAYLLDCRRCLKEEVEGAMGIATSPIFDPGVALR